MALRVGATEEERVQVIGKLKEGKTFEEATAHLRGVVEPDWMKANQDELLMVAGKKAKRPATEEEKAAAATLLKQKNLAGELVYPTVAALAPVFPAVDPKTLAAQK